MPAYEHILHLAQFLLIFNRFPELRRFSRGLKGKVAEPCEAHPELGEQLDKMQKYMTTKLSDTEPFGVDFPFDPC